MKHSAAAVFVYACVLIAGCSDRPSIELPTDTNVNPIQDQDSGSSLVAICDGAPQGTPCGEPGDRMHCVFDACIRNACGDGWPADGEACDDGNETDGDGCSARCRMEIAPGCGNDVLEPGEECDDGNTSSDDRCTVQCTNTECGDGIVSRGEDCDDGNTSNGDECTSRCTTPGKLCGNGVLDEDDGEACDDGNNTDFDGCEGDCSLPPECGNGKVEGSEECDDGNTSPGDTCAANCTTPIAGAAGSGGAGSGSAGMGAAGSGAAGTGVAGTGVAGTGVAGTGAAGSGAAGTGAAGSGAAGSGGVDAGCEACRELNCSNYLEFINPLAGCFEAGSDGISARSAFGTTFSAAQIQACVDAVGCAHVKGCGFELGRPAAQCYCGSAYPNNGDCAAGAAGTQNGACKAQFEAATGSTLPSVVVTNLKALDQPSGWAFYLLECEATFCNDSIDGDCTP